MSKYFLFTGLAFNFSCFAVDGIPGLAMAITGLVLTISALFMQHFEHKKR